MKKIILDCDPGYDDAVAILLALGNPVLDILGITTVAGNHSIDSVVQNALKLLTYLGFKNIPVYKGCSRPLIKDVVTTQIHGGEMGISPSILQENFLQIENEHAVDFIIQSLMSSNEADITLVCTAALTNIAIAVRKEPKIVNKVKELVIMGGGISGGNITPVSEFNIYFDPEAAYIVFNETWPITMVGLDLTHQALATQRVVDTIRKLSGKVSSLMLDMIEEFTRTYKNVYGFPAPPVHDPCTIAYVIDSTVMECVKAPVFIELFGQHTKGMTIVDLRKPSPDSKVQVATKLRVEYFWGMIYQAIQNLQGGG